MRLSLSSNALQQLCIYYLITWLVAPPLAYGNIFRIISVVCVLIWLLLEFGHNQQNTDEAFSKVVHRYTLSSILYGVVLLLSRMLFHHLNFTSAFMYDIPTYILLLFGYFAAQYIKRGRAEEIIKFFNYILILGVIFSITTIFRGAEYSTVTRFAGGETSEAANLLSRQAAIRGIGGFGFTCFASCLSPMLLHLTIRRKSLWYVMSFVIVEAEVFSAGYALALMISFLGIGTVLFFNSRSGLFRILVVASIIILLFAWNSIISGLFSLLQKVAAGSMYANKVEDIFTSILGGESEGTVAGRQVRYQASLESIIRYPILGSYIFAGTRSVGYHSSILDTFAAYGWIPGFAWLYITVVFPNKCGQLINRDSTFKYLVTLVLFCTALFNQYTMHMGVFYFICPAISTIILREREAIENL